MQQRHFAFISEHTSDLRHLPGKQNTMADLLSRQVLAISTLLNSDLLERIAKEQAIDKELADLRNKFPTRFIEKDVDGVKVMGDSVNEFRIFVPANLRVDVFKLVHEFGHPGSRQTRINIAKTFMWLNMDQTVRGIVKACIA